MSANCRYCGTDCPESGEHDRFFECCLYTERKPTNADRIRAMSDDELSKFLLAWVECDNQRYMCSPEERGARRKCDGRCVSGRMKWLRSEAKEETE